MTSGEKIGIITATIEEKGSRGSEDTGGRLIREAIIPEVMGVRRTEVELDKLKAEIKAFIGAMREMLDEADPPNSQMRLEEVELSVEINGEGKVSLLGIGGKAGGKGAMTFKFKRKDG
ncbi:Pepco domain-containing protein [Aphanothece sacrum]|uniref:Pepco domain-containing protein n=1 Tax=Aphanothece sacrum FPU1 TaxID=1920663 RepID=A0A401IM16_APHSA|nr:hypothetical protein [Aphanothece sacrum]GBF82268.1 hypothetical protein AsFPU1_3696 [Aphanothece sacrum FPU1]GBF87194.1 hypothetical protein AsFPU3_4276 [Aphanothece sacrum FPU3]